MAEQQAREMPYLDSHNTALLQSLGTLVNGKPFSQFTIPQQRELFHEVQKPAPTYSGISVSSHKITSSHGEVTTYLYKPENVKCSLPFVYYCHGGGWIFGGAAEYEAFIVELVTRTGLAVVFPEYALAPEQKSPVQQEQCLEVLQDVLKVGGEHGLAVGKVVLAGDSSGGQLISAIAILNKQRSLNLPIVHQVMLHPYVNVTAPLCSGVMRDPVWAEQQLGAYFSEVEERSEILAAPGLMSSEEAALYMSPTTLVISDQDPFKEQNEAFARLLQQAGVSCGVMQAYGSLHAVEIFSQARDGPTAQLIMTMISGKLNEVLSV